MSGLAFVPVPSLMDYPAPAARLHLRRVAAFAVLLVMMLAATSIPPSVYAGPSPAIAPSRISVDGALGQGEDIRFPSLSIANLGDEASDFVVELTNFSDQSELRPPDLWFQLEPTRFNLEPGATETVSFRMEIPRDAEPGDYRVLIRAHVEAPSDGSGGAVVSAAVATTLTFTVENRDFHFYDPVVDFFSDRAPFSYIGLALIFAAVAVELFRRRFRISFGVQRRE